jgi:hypothetical protein
MAARTWEDASRPGARLLFRVFFFVFLVIIVDEISVVSGFVFLFLFVFFVHVIGDEIQVDGMRLRDLEFGFALRTTQDLALFDFVFVDIDFGGTFGATNHGSTLRTVLRIMGARGPCPPPVQRIIYRGT